MTGDHAPGHEGAGFGALLRKSRRAVGLTQAELADRAGIGVRTVRDLERGRASRPQRSTVSLLADALGLSGGERAAFHATARGQPGLREAAAPATVPTIALPAAAPLIGRDRDIAELAELLTEPTPLTTLVGLAGVGKSSLALAVAHTVADSFPGGQGGIVVVEASTEADLVSTIASAFRVPRAEDLTSYLSDVPALLLLDAVERAPAAVAGALRWLSRSVPALRILATGRHPVGVPGERIWPVVPLEVPAETVSDLETAARFPAVELVLTRLRQVRRTPPQPDEAGALVTLVRRLGGLPLALELAAARGRVLDLNEILHRYGDRVLDLAGTPAAPDAVALTLRDAVAASYGLLEPAERYALRRLSVFRHRWSVELAEALLTDEDAPGGGPVGGDSEPLLDRLLALGLISVRGAGPTRFRLLDVVRDFAAEQACAAGELTVARRRHAVVFTRLAARVAPRLVGAEMAAAVAQLDDVAADLSSALAHAAADDPPIALELASKLPRWWRFRGRDVAGRQWLRRLLDDPRTAHADPRVRAWAAVGAAQLAMEHDAGQEEAAALEAALAEFIRLGDVPGELTARSVLCNIFMAISGYDEARRHATAVLTLARRIGSIRDMAIALNSLTWHDIRTGDLTAARRRMAEVDRLTVQSGEERLRALTRASLAEVARLAGRFDEAEAVGRRAIVMLEEVGDPGHRWRVLGTIGLALAQAGRLEDAMEVLAELRQHGSGPVAEAACAAMEAQLALQRGERALAAEWFLVAARIQGGDPERRDRGRASGTNGFDLRDVAEALVEAAAATDDAAARESILQWLSWVCADGGITLLPREKALLRGLSIPRQRGPETGPAGPDATGAAAAGPDPPGPDAAGSEAAGPDADSSVRSGRAGKR